MSEEQKYLLRTEKGDLGPVIRKEIVQLLLTNKISDLTPCCKVGENNWSLVSDHVQVAVGKETRPLSVTKKTVRITFPSGMR
ncbi:MAG: hypothetical protein AAGA18_03980 [Verrucomicrobiota bacterium]